jgi:hypothetical protein
MSISEIRSIEIVVDRVRSGDRRKERSTTEEYVHSNKDFTKSIAKVYRVSDQNVCRIAFIDAEQFTDTTSLNDSARELKMRVQDVRSIRKAIDSDRIPLVRPRPQPAAPGGATPQQAAQKTKGKKGDPPQEAKASTKTPIPRAWTVSTNGKIPMHPMDRRNTENLLRLLEKTEAMDLLFVERKAYEVINDPQAKRTINQGDLFKEKDRNGRIITLTKPDDIVWHWGEMAKKTWKVLTVTPNNRGKEVELPLGTAVLRPSDKGLELYRKVAPLLKKLFFDELANPSTGFYFPQKHGAPRGGKILLGYGKPGEKIPGEKYYDPTMANNLSYMPTLVKEFIVSLAKGLADILGVPYSRIAGWKILLVGYMGYDLTVSVTATDTGFHFHIDGIKDFGVYPGVVANMAISCFDNAVDYIKYFDLATVYGLQTGVKRLELHQGDICVISGPARRDEGHSVPNQPDPNITIAFKLPFEDLSECPHDYIEVESNPSVDCGRPTYLINAKKALASQRE